MKNNEIIPISLSGFSINFIIPEIFSFLRNSNYNYIIRISSELSKYYVIKKTIRKKMKILLLSHETGL